MLEESGRSTTNHPAHGEAGPIPAALQRTSERRYAVRYRLCWRRRGSDRDDAYTPGRSACCATKGREASAQRITLAAAVNLGRTGLNPPAQAAVYAHVPCTWL